MNPWYTCPICRKRFPPEAQRMGLVCQHSDEEWAKYKREQFEPEQPANTGGE